MDAPHILSLPRLAFGMIPALAVVIVMGRWSLNINKPTIALARMVFQLLLVGFLLASIFESNRGSVVLLVCAVMICAAAGIALRTIPST